MPLGAAVILGIIAGAFGAVQKGLEAYKTGTGSGPTLPDDKKPPKTLEELVQSVIDVLQKFWYIPVALFILMNKKLRTKIGL